MMKSRDQEEGDRNNLKSYLLDFHYIQDLQNLIQLSVVLSPLQGEGNVIHKRSMPLS